MPATLTQSVVTINLASPFVVNAGDMDALRFDFNLQKSIQVDANGNITGQVTPTLDLKALSQAIPKITSMSSTRVLSASMLPLIPSSSKAHTAANTRCNSHPIQSSRTTKLSLT